MTRVNPEKKERALLAVPSVEGTADFCNISLYRGIDVVEPGDGESIESIPIDGVYQNDVNQFMIDTETATHKYLMDVLKNTIKLKALAISSQADYGSVLSLHREGTISDYTDMHYYFQHPYSNDEIKYQTYHFYIGNTPLIKDPKYEIYSKFARNRFIDKPLSMSETNMPFPNEYQHELFPIALAGASWQNIGAVYQFNWDPDYSQRNYVSGFYTFADNPTLIVTSKVMAYAYRKGYIKAAEKKVIVHFGLKAIKEDLKARLVNRYSYSQASYKPFQDAIYYTQFHDDRHLSIEYPDPNTTDKWTFPLKTEQIEWVQNETDVFFKTVAPNIRIMSSFMNGEERKLGDVTIKVKAPSRYTASVIIESLDDLPINESGSIVVVVASTVKNDDVVWNADRTTTEANWGSTCAMHLYVDFEITIPGNDNVTIYKLTPNSEINGTVESQSTGTSFKFSSSKETASMWYHITRDVSKKSEEHEKEKENEQENNSSSLSPGVIAAIVIVSLIVVAAAIFGVLMFIRSKKNKDDETNDDDAV